MRRAIWRSWPGTIALYGALALHVGLALWKLILRRTWRLAPWEVAQIVLGLSIPFLAAAHVAATRGLASLYGFDDTYGRLLSLLWPGLAFSQSFLLVVVWLHAVIGLHFWLRTKAWYERWSPLLLVLAVMIPTVALTGWMEGARRLALDGEPADRPGFRVREGRTAHRPGEDGRLVRVRRRRRGARRDAGARLVHPRPGDHLSGAHRPRRAGRDASRDQPRGRRSACVGLRRARPLHDLPGARHRGRGPARAAEPGRSGGADAHPRSGGRAARLPDPAGPRAESAPADPASRRRAGRRPRHVPLGRRAPDHGDVLGPARLHDLGGAALSV